MREHRDHSHHGESPPPGRLAPFLPDHDGFKILASIVAIVATIAFLNQVFNVDPRILWLGVLGIVGLLLVIVGLLGMWQERRDEEEFFFDDHY